MKVHGPVPAQRSSLRPWYSTTLEVSPKNVMVPLRETGLAIAVAVGRVVGVALAVGDGLGDGVGASVAVGAIVSVGSGVAVGVAPPDDSYTARLLAGGAPKPAAKVTEEAGELAVAALAESDERVADESADLLYHVLVLLHSRGLTLADVERRLAGRRPR
ncbi:hypothetical protein BH23CHL7_BH23CHL7_05160 [soil metagenome]